MSLVGTRPPTVDEWEQYEPHHRARMAFRPGLTGLWQVSGRSNIRLNEDYLVKKQELSDITGIQPSNLARFESGGRVPTLIVLEKYANALGKHIEIKICDN